MAFAELLAKALLKLLTDDDYVELGDPNHLFVLDCLRCEEHYGPCDNCQIQVVEYPMHIMRFGLQISQPTTTYMWFQSWFLHLRKWWGPPPFITYRLCNGCFYRHVKARFLKQMNGQVSKLLLKYFVTATATPLAMIPAVLLQIIFDYAISVSYQCQSPEAPPKEIEFEDGIWWGTNLSCCWRNPFLCSAPFQQDCEENEDFLKSNPDGTYFFYVKRARMYL